MRRPGRKDWFPNFDSCIIACTCEEVAYRGSVEDLKSMSRNRRVGAVFVTVFLALGITSVVLDRVTKVKAAAVMAPRFEVAPMWPKPLPNHWVVGNVIGVTVDSNDHIWMVHRGAALERMETYAAQPPPR